MLWRWSNSSKLSLPLHLPLFPQQFASKQVGQQMQMTELWKWVWGYSWLHQKGQKQCPLTDKALPSLHTSIKKKYLLCWLCFCPYWGKFADILTRILKKCCIISNSLDVGKVDQLLKCDEESILLLHTIVSPETAIVLAGAVLTKESLSPAVGIFCLGLYLHFLKLNCFTDIDGLNLIKILAISKLILQHVCWDVL